MRRHMRNVASRHCLSLSTQIIRIAALGRPGDDYPVTHMRNHKHLRIVTDRNTLKTPKFNI